MVPAIMMNNFVNAINQLSDVEIDKVFHARPFMYIFCFIIIFWYFANKFSLKLSKVNKPHLLLASGDFSIAEGIAIAIASPMMVSNGHFSLFNFSAVSHISY